MREEIDDIIKEAICQKENGASEYDIMKFVHIRLGKLLVYNNSYSNKIEKSYVDENGKLIDVETEVSHRRKVALEEAETLVDNPEQVCKGMAEIYAAILSEIGIDAKVIGAEHKGDVDGEVRDGKIIDVPKIYTAVFHENRTIKVGENQKKGDRRAGHYYVSVRADQKEYIQDFIIDKALARIKCGESNIDENIAGICEKLEYTERAENNLPLNDKFVENLWEDFEKYQSENPEDIGMTGKINFVFQKLSEVQDRCGFEESNDMVNMQTMALLTLEEKRNFKNQFKICNLLKEDENSCEVMCILRLDGENYLVKSDDNKIGNLASGKVSFEDIQSVLWNGFRPRKSLDGQSLNEMLGIKNRDVKEMEEVASSEEMELE